MHRLLLVICLVVLVPEASPAAATLPGQGPGDQPVRVVGSIPDFAWLAGEIGGERVSAGSIALGNQDPHFVLPKPSFAIQLREADLFINTGMDMEMWAPTLLDRARNRRIMEGAPGYVMVAEGVQLIDVPTGSLDRSQGEIHVYGNPHFHTSPIEVRQVAGNIMRGLQRVDPGYSEHYQAGYERFITRIDEALYGSELVRIVGGDRLGDLVRSGELIPFLEAGEQNGTRLIDLLGGWMKKALPLRGIRLITYHKNWGYLARDFGFQVVNYVEPKPGIPPSARHVRELTNQITNQDIRLLIVAGYFERNTPRSVADRTGVEVLFLPLSVTGEPGIDDMFQLYDYWIDQLTSALAAAR
jgi:zinc/manganese transport system substrate-binding protein